MTLFYPPFLRSNELTIPSPDEYNSEVWDGRATQDAIEWVTLRDTEIQRCRGGKRLYQNDHRLFESFLEIKGF
jgi:hypothetical protein